jgi:hypothetical protein
VPKIYRELRGSGDVREEDDDTREQFIRTGSGVSEARPADKWDWYFLMQHHGAPTRLLDWTDGALLGLYFAVRENEGYHDAAVWALDPWELNKKVVHKKEVLPPGEPGLTKDDRERYDSWLKERFTRRQRWPRRPVAVYPRHSVRRIAAQRSCFTIHGSDPRGLETLVPKLGVPIAKIIIPSWSVGSIQDCLETCGIDETSVFPDLDGLGRSSSLSEKKSELEQAHEGVYTRLRPSKIDKHGLAFLL